MRKKKKKIYIYIYIYIYKVEKIFFFYSVKLKKIEESKFLEIYLGIMENEEKKILGIYIFFCNFSSGWNKEKKM